MTPPSPNVPDAAWGAAAGIQFQRPVPGYRLAFLSVPDFLATCLTKSVGQAFRTAPPLVFGGGDFREPFLGTAELETLNRFKAMKKQVEWMAGRYVAKQLARAFLDGRPSLRETRIAYRPKGAPYFTQAPSLCLSISHSEAYAVAGIGLARSNILGLDLERIHPASRRLLLRTAFSIREREDLESRDDAALFLRWTAKEAYLKAVGLGFHESLKQVEILDDMVWHHGRPVTSFTLHSSLPFPGYAFSIVST